MSSYTSSSAGLNAMFGLITAILLVAFALILSQKWKSEVSQDAAEIDKCMATLRTIQAKGSSAADDEERERAITALAAWGENFAKVNRSNDEGMRRVLQGNQSLLLAASACLCLSFFVTLRSWRVTRRRNRVTGDG